MSHMMSSFGWGRVALLGAALGLGLGSGACRDSRASAGTASAGAARADGRAHFDLDVARDASDSRPASRPLPRPESEAVIAHEVTFGSLEWASGLPRTIRLHGFLVEPVDNAETRLIARRPAVIIAHGLGGRADIDTAVSVARGLNVVALAISAPGLGKSQGRAVTFDDARPLYDPVGTSGAAGCTPTCSGCSVR